MLAREQRVKLLQDQENTVNTLLAPHMDPKKFSNYTKTTLHTLEQLSKQLQYSIAAIQSREEAFAQSMQNMIKVWNMLEENGTLAQWKSELSNPEFDDDE